MSCRVEPHEVNWTKPLFMIVSAPLLAPGAKDMADMPSLWQADDTDPTRSFNQRLTTSIAIVPSSPSLASTAHQIRPY